MPVVNLARQDTNYAFFSKRDVEHNNGKCQNVHDIGLFLRWLNITCFWS